MAEPFLAEIRIFGFNFAPRGWATCDGQLLPISQNTALFALVGAMYGGNGQTTFGLPDLRDSAPLGQGQGPGMTFRGQGDQGGATEVTLTNSQLPFHTHVPQASSGEADSADPAGNVWAQALGERGTVNYYNSAGNSQMSFAAVDPVGGGQPHNNMHPYLALSFCIALQGIFPQRS